MLERQDLSRRGLSSEVVEIVREVIECLAPEIVSQALEAMTLLESRHLQARLSSQLVSGQRQWKERCTDGSLTTRVVEVE